MRVNFFSNFYFKFILLTSNFKYILNIFIYKFKYKLILQLQNSLNINIKLLKLIFTLAKSCLNIYMQIQIIN